MVLVPQDVWVTANFKETQLDAHAAGAAGRRSRSTPFRRASSRATSTASSAGPARGSACCRRRTRPATTSRSCSACRSRSCSTSRRRADRPLAPGHVGRADGPRALRRTSRHGGRRRGRLQPRAAAARNPWADRARWSSIATFMEVLDTAIANVALRHIAGNLSAERRREHLGADQLPGRQRDRPADQRLARQRVRAQALLHDLRRAVHGQLAAVRAGADPDGG